MSKLTVIARVILAVILLAFGLMNLFGVAPQTEYPEAAATFLGGLFVSGYVFPLLNLMMVIVGVLLVVNRFVPLALVLFAPFTVNIILFHVYLDMSSIGPGLVVLILHLYLLFANFESYKPLLKAKVNNTTN